MGVIKFLSYAKYPNQIVLVYVLFLFWQFLLFWHFLKNLFAALSRFDNEIIGWRQKVSFMIFMSKFSIEACPQMKYELVVQR